MPYSLAERGDHHQSDSIARFDPRFWTVDFPRPMMMAPTTLAPDGLRIDIAFSSDDQLGGLIWESEDRWDHPLLAYETARDYRRLTLSFRYRSDGVMPLNAVNGPVLTIEGRDEAGTPRSWYVRLWNYAEGTPSDAQVSLPFSALDGGFLLPGEADPVFAGDIDRLFLSLVPDDYGGGEGAYAHPKAAWVELSDIHADGARAVLPIGDVMLPEQRASIATAYDDAYNQVPERLVRQALALGYRGAINHYVGMSHFFALGGDGVVDAGAADPLCEPARRWHEQFAAITKSWGYDLIISLSYELLDQHCAEVWKQRYLDGSPALTGWEPPSALLSPANDAAMAWLETVALAFAAILRDAGQPVRVQIGEPWWWLAEDGRIALYDEAMRALSGGEAMAEIAEMRAALSPEQITLLNEAGAVLAASTAQIGTALRNAGCDELLLLAYLPTSLNEGMPEAWRANLPDGWAAPAFDRVQYEDYEWVTAGRHDLTEAAIASLAARWSYSLADSHYFAGFVLDAADRDQWSVIETAVQRAFERGHAETFVWALPQVVRDGFTRFDFPEDETMLPSFHDTLFPLALGRHAEVVSQFSTRIVTMTSGHERRSAEWADARMAYDIGPGLRSEEDLATLARFYRARHGPAIAFRFTDPFDHSSAADGGEPGPLDQIIGTGDGAQTAFALVKSYGEAEDAQRRRLTRPRAGTLCVAVDGVETSAFTLEDFGTVRLATPPDEGAVVTAGLLFDVPVRFAEDRLAINAATFRAGEAPSVPLVEVKEGE